ncbi:unnamed protein product [Aphanomyces euteiches]
MAEQTLGGLVGQLVAHSLVMGPVENSKPSRDFSANTIQEFSAPRHWQSFAFVRHAARIDFGDGSVIRDCHLEQLQHVPELEFRQCDLIESPHALANCRVLRFISCDGLTDVGGLSDVQDLTVTGSRHVLNLDKLGNLRVLATGSSFASPIPSVSSCLTAPARSTPWSSFNFLDELHLKQCHELPESIDFQVASVSLSSCESLESIACFNRAAQLELVRTRALTPEPFQGFSLLQSIRIQASTCLVDLSDLANVHHVSLSLCVNLQDIAPLASANTVELSCCPQLQSVAPLQYVPNVTLSRCADLTDVSSLTHNTVVRLSECYRVTQVSALAAHCHTVDIARCYRITDAAALAAAGSMHTVALDGCNVAQEDARAWLNHPTLHTIDLSNNLDIHDASPFAHLHTVFLDRTSIRDVTPLRDVHTLSLSSCDLLQDVSALGNVHTLDLSYCMNIRDVSALGTVHTLNLAGTLVEDVAALAMVYELNLSGCPQLTDDQVNSLQFNHTLLLMGCAQLTRVDGLRFIHTLNLANCIGITDVSMLGHVHALDLTGCLNVQDRPLQN